MHWALDSFNIRNGKILWFDDPLHPLILVAWRDNDFNIGNSKILVHKSVEIYSEEKNKRNKESIGAFSYASLFLSSMNHLIIIILFCLRSLTLPFVQREEFRKKADERNKIKNQTHFLLTARWWNSAEIAFCLSISFETDEI